MEGAKLVAAHGPARLSRQPDHPHQPCQHQVQRAQGKKCLGRLRQAVDRIESACQHAEGQCRSDDPDQAGPENPLGPGQTVEQPMHPGNGSLRIKSRIIGGPPPAPSHQRPQHRSDRMQDHQATTAG